MEQIQATEQSYQERLKETEQSYQERLKETEQSYEAQILELQQAQASSSEPEVIKLNFRKLSNLIRLRF